MKKLITIQKNRSSHWVGDGFPVRTIFSYNDLAKDVSPFLLLDYAGPAEFPQTTKKLGVGPHPHRGIETVTIVYSGEVEHRDSAGHGGAIGPGDVQWMSAASGIVHEEYHGKSFAKTGGIFEMVQLWVNLPKKDKMAKARYQEILGKQIPLTSFSDGAGTLRVIAGEYGETKGPAMTFSPINLWDIKLTSKSNVNLKVPVGHTASVFVLKGKLQVPSGQSISEAEIGVFETEGSDLHIDALEDTKLLFLGGEPLNEPIVGHGPFVMNTIEEIHQAFADYKSGKMGQLDS